MSWAGSLISLVCGGLVGPAGLRRRVITDFALSRAHESANTPLAKATSKRRSYFLAARGKTVGHPRTASRCGLTENKCLLDSAAMPTFADVIVRTLT